MSDPVQMSLPESTADIRALVQGNPGWAAELRSAMEQGAGTALLGVTKKRLEKEFRIVHTDPHFDDTNLKNDIRFKLGVIWMANWLLGLPAAADDYLHQDEHPEEE